jgi:hypothetical protein
MTERQRLRLLLGGLGVVLAIAVVPRLIPDSTEPVAEGAPRTRTRSGAKEAERPLVETVVDLDLAALEPNAGRVTIGRDPWRFRPKPAPPAPPPRVEPVRLPPAPAPVAPPPPSGPQPPSTAHLKYLGSFGPKNAEIAVVRGHGDELWVVREGDLVEDVFTIQTIGLESVDIGFVEFPDVKPRRLGLGS